MKTVLTIALSIAVNILNWYLGRRAGRIEGFRRGYEEGCKDAFALLAKAFAKPMDAIRKNVNKEN